MATYLTPDRIRTEKIGNSAITIKEKIIPASARATKDLIKVDCPAWAKKGQPMKDNIKLGVDGVPKGITVHNTGPITVPPATTMAEQYTRATWPNCNMAGVAVTFYVWHSDIWQNLEETERGRHAADGSTRRNGNRSGQKIGGNVDTISIEAIGPDSETETTTQILCAYLCEKYGLDPMLDIYQHNFFYPAKNCPVYIRPHWGTFLSGIKNLLNQTTAVVPEKPPAAPGMFDVVTTIPGYSTAANAKSRTSPRSSVVPGRYYVFNMSGGMVNVTRVSTVPGSWINPSDNTTSTTPTTPKPSVVSVGSNVKLRPGCRTYEGRTLLKFVYNLTYKVKEIRGDRAVVTYLGVVMAAINVKDLIPLN